MAKMDLDEPEAAPVRRGRGRAKKVKDGNEAGEGLDPDASVQWFERVVPEETPSASIDVEVQWDDELDAAPTLVLPRRRLM